MAGLGRKDFQAGEVLSAADVNGYLMDQSVMVFDDATARDAAIGTPTEGMIAYLKDTDDLLKYTTTWESVSNPGDITAVTAGTALTGGGTSGDVTLNVDLTEVQPNVITTEGDLVIGDSNGDAIRLAIGTADQVLTSNGTTATWEDAGGGGGIELISTHTLSGITTLTVTGLPQSYKAIRIVGSEYTSANPFQIRVIPTRGSDIAMQTFYVRANGFQGQTQQITSTLIESRNALGAGQSDTSCYFTFYDYTLTGEFPFEGISNYRDNNGGNPNSEIFGGTIDYPGAMTGFRFTTNNTNFTSGIIKVYGIN